MELLSRGYHFSNGEPALGFEDTMKLVYEILNSAAEDMEKIEIYNPNWEGE